MKKEKFPLMVYKTKSLGGHRIDGCPLRFSEAPCLKGYYREMKKAKLIFEINLTLLWLGYPDSNQE